MQGKSLDNPCSCRTAHKRRKYRKKINIFIRPAAKLNRFISHLNKWLSATE